MNALKARKTAYMALTIALAMILSFVESQVPALVAIPGVKIGLANIAVMFALYKFGWKEAVGISILRVVLVSALFGNAMSILYSLAGAALSLLGMIALRRIKALSCISVSVCGGVLHNVGQTLMAWLLLDTAAVTYYLPFLVLSGTVSGVAIGIAAGIMIGRVDLDKVH